MHRPGHKVTLTSRAFRNDQLPLLFQELHELTGFDMALPMNSGAEAVETAIKAARKWGYKVKGIPEGKAEIIVCANNFHGRTVTIVSFSTDEQYRDGFGPFTPGFKVIPFGDAEALREAITPNTCAFLVEPIQGEAGIVIPPDGFLKQAAAICRANNVLFIADEIQSGLGRTGKLFAYHARRHHARRGHHRQGARRAASIRCRRCWPRRRCWASSSPATTAAPSAAIRWPAPSRALRCGCWSTRSWSSAPPNWATIS